MRASEQRDIRALVAILRMADRMDYDHQQTVSRVRVRQTSRGILTGMKMKRASELILWGTQRGAQLLEKESGRKVFVERIS